jgi:putative DNA primase/helicase
MNELPSKDKFAPLAEAEIAAITAIEAPVADKGECIMPVPANAPERPKTHWTCGAPSHVWTYSDPRGDVLSYVFRFETADGKEIRPLSLWRAPNGRVEWRWKGVPEPRPLYGLDRLAANPDAPVVVREGEKAADAAVRLFPDYVATTSLGGSQSAKKANWEPLTGRRALLWPNADEAGVKYAAEAGKILHALGCEISVIDCTALASLTPDGAKREPVKGWDAADAVEEWRDLAALRKKAIKLAKPYEPGAAAQPGSEEVDREIARLAKLRRVDYERERISAAKRLNLRAPILDKLVAAERKEDDGLGQGRKLELPDPVPCPEPVSGPELIAGLEAGISHYVALPKDVAFTVSLWVLHTYCFDAFTCTPRLAITSPEKGCGKTTLLDVLSELVPRCLMTGSISPASLFRTIELAKPVILIDEADTFLGDKEELRGILNQGHRAGGQVLRTVGDDHEPRAFNVHAPAAIAMIGNLHGTLADRSIAIQMRRLAPGEKVARFRAGRTPELGMFARKAARWNVDNAVAIESREPEIPAAIFNRQADNWEPLLAIAEVAGPEIAERARAAALAACGAREDESLGVKLLDDIREAFEAAYKDELPSKELVEALAAMADRPWCECNHGKPVTRNWLARRLRDFGVRPGNIGPKKNRAKGYQKADFEDAFTRYLPKGRIQSVYPYTSNDFNDLGDNQAVHQKDRCTDENPANPVILKEVRGCTVQNPEAGERTQVSAPQTSKVRILL